jgi:hypothetical protein
MGCRRTSRNMGSGILDTLLLRYPVRFIGQISNTYRLAKLDSFLGKHQTLEIGRARQFFRETSNPYRQQIL